MPPASVIFGIIAAVVAVASTATTLGTQAAENKDIEQLQGQERQRALVARQQERANIAKQNKLAKQQLNLNQKKLDYDKKKMKQEFDLAEADIQQQQQDYATQERQSLFGAAPSQKAVTKIEDAQKRSQRWSF